VIRQAAQEAGPFRSMLGISWFWLAGATYLSQFPAYVRFILQAEEMVVTLFLTLFSVGIAFGSLLCNRLLAGRLSASCVPWGALGIGLFSIDLWLASPPPAAAGELTTLSAFLATRCIGEFSPISLGSLPRAGFLSCRSTRCCRR
jgi:acyl-[acyl-carrier-protein]-phospholipid O-acyltransferase/long-chain-fatty-acid--[acyl-carrier-protein] ligase